MALAGRLLLPLRNSSLRTLLRSPSLLFSPSISPYDPESQKLWQIIYFPCIPEDDTAAVHALLCSYHLLQDLIYRRFVPPAVKEERTYIVLKCDVMNLQIRPSFTEPLHKNKELLHITSYDQFEYALSEILAIHTDEWENPRKTWGKMISLFSFSVFLAQKYWTDEDRVEEISRYLAKYILKYGLPSIRSSGGWDILLKDFHDIQDSEPMKSVFYRKLT